MSKVGVKKMGGRCSACGKMGKVAEARGNAFWCSKCAHLAPPVPDFNQKPKDPKNTDRETIIFHPGREEGVGGNEG